MPIACPRTTLKSAGLQKARNFDWKWAHHATPEAHTIYRISKRYKSIGLPILRNIQKLKAKNFDWRRETLTESELIMPKPQLTRLDLKTSKSKPIGEPDYQLTSSQSWFLAVNALAFWPAGHPSFNEEIEQRWYIWSYMYLAQLYSAWLWKITLGAKFSHAQLQCICLLTMITWKLMVWCIKVYDILADKQGWKDNAMQLRLDRFALPQQKFAVWILTFFFNPKLN